MNPSLGRVAQVTHALARRLRRPVLAAAGDLAPLDRRLGLLQLLRVGLAVLAAATAFALPDALADRGPQLAALGAVHVVASSAAELVRRRFHRRTPAVIGGMVLLDGVYLATAMALTGGPQSPLASLVLVHVVAVTLLLSFRTGLKAGLWHALLLFVSSWLQRAGVVPEGAGLTPGQAAVLGALALLAVALASAGFSSLNEGELRRGQAELRALAEMARRMAGASDPDQLVTALLAGVADAFGPLRAAVVLHDEPGGRVRAFTRGPDGDLAGLTAPATTARVALRFPHPRLVRALDDRHEPILAQVLPGANNVVVVPLVAEGDAMGALAVERGGGPAARVTARTVDLLDQFAAHAALALRAASLRAEVGRLADTDSLTGLPNRRVFQEALARELAVADRRGEPCALILLDVDHFKGINDSLGHQAGDEVLRRVGRALAETARETDTAARYGGEEFAVLAPGCSTAEAVVVAERFRKAIAVASGPVPITVSAGVASYPSDGGDGGWLVTAADVALYRAKNLGRDRTVRFRRPRTVGRRSHVA